MTSSEIFCFIPAKGASTRLEKKNIIKLKGKELIGYAIEAALSSNLFQENVIVSTESNEIQRISQKYGAKTPYLRDPKLAKDPYGIVDVILNFFELFPSYRSFKYVAILLPTSPLTLPKDIIGAFDLIRNNKMDAVMTITKCHPNSMRSIRMIDDKVVPVFPKAIKKKSQELEDTYWLNGACTIISVEKLIREKTYFVENLGGYELPWYRSVDIDEEQDLRYANYLIENNFSG